MVHELDDPMLTLYVARRLPAYQEYGVDPQKNDIYVIKGRFRSPSAEAVSEKPIWVPPLQFARRVTRQVVAALAEEVDPAYAQEVYKSALRVFEKSERVQEVLPLFKTETPKI